MRYNVSRGKTFKETTEILSCSFTDILIIVLCKRPINSAFSRFGRNFKSTKYDYIIFFTKM